MVGAPTFVEQLNRDKLTPKDEKYEDPVPSFEKGVSRYDPIRFVGPPCGLTDQQGPRAPRWPCVSPQTASAQSPSVLVTTADAMSADIWAVLNTNGISGTTLLAQGASGFITGDASGGCWDPVDQKAHFIGTDHQPGTVQRHVVYDAATNTWVRLSDPPFGTGTINHAWEGTVCDMRGRALYRINNASLSLRRYSFASGQWTNLGAPPSSVMSYPNGFPGLAWHSQLGTVGQLVMTGAEAGTDVDLGDCIFMHIIAHPSGAVYQRIKGNRQPIQFPDGTKPGRS